MSVDLITVHSRRIMRLVQPESYEIQANGILTRLGSTIYAGQG
jgi:hypothetical protein